jgi:hypothetical protein
LTNSPHDGIRNGGGVGRRESSAHRTPHPCVFLPVDAGIRQHGFVGGKPKAVFLSKSSAFNLVEFQLCSFVRHY